MSKFDFKKLAKAANDKKWNTIIKRKKNYGVRTIAKEVGVSAACVSRILNGKEIELNNAILFCDWLEIGIEHFIKK